jgi:ribosomal protein S18 acetylase RimI-like enzyme
MNITIEVFGMTSVIIGILRFDIVKFDLNFTSKMLAYYEAMKSMYVDKITIDDGFINISSKDIKDGKWNFAYSDSDDVDATFEKSQSRVYVLSKNLSQDKLNRCFNKYNVSYENSWFCNDLSKVKLKLKSDLRIQIELCEDKDIVINAIIEGFNLNDPSYKETLERKWDLEDTIHLIAKYEGNVAGLASCTIKGDVAYLCNVTTLKQYKGHGIAKEVILNMVKVLKDREVKQVIFSTPKDGFTEVFYKRLGFTVVEYGYCLEEK